MIIDFLSDIYLGAFIRPPFPLFCAEAFPRENKKSSTQAGAQIGLSIQF